MHFKFNDIFTSWKIEIKHIVCVLTHFKYRVFWKSETSMIFQNCGSHIKYKSVQWGIEMECESENTMEGSNVCAMSRARYGRAD